MSVGEASAFWTDYRGVCWPVVTSSHRLKFKLRAHAAIRAHVFHHDGYACVQCGVQADCVPATYDGRLTLSITNACGEWSCLMLDHKLCMAAGGSHHVSNFQTLCERCNCSKGTPDRVLAQRRKGEELHA